MYLIRSALFFGCLYHNLRPLLVLLLGTEVQSTVYTCNKQQTRCFCVFNNLLLANVMFRRMEHLKYLKGRKICLFEITVPEFPCTYRQKCMFTYKKYVITHDSRSLERGSKLELPRSK